MDPELVLSSHFQCLSTNTKPILVSHGPYPQMNHKLVDVPRMAKNPQRLGIGLQPKRLKIQILGRSKIEIKTNQNGGDLSGDTH